MNENGQKHRVRVAHFLIALASFFLVFGLYMLAVGIISNDYAQWHIGVGLLLGSAIIVVVCGGIRARIRKYERARRQRMAEAIPKRRWRPV